MKKIICLILIIISLFSLGACSDSEFPPVESTDEEARVLMTVRYEKEEYEIRYELYRSLFLNFKTEYDGGDSSFWNRPESAEAKEKINGTIVNFCKDIFAVLHLAKSIGFDPYSKEADKLVEEYISASVNGNSDIAEGYGGDYDAYLESLREMNLNYSVQTLLYRYSIAYDKIVEYYAGSMNADNPMPGDEALERKHEGPEHIQGSPVSASELEMRDPFPVS